MPLFLRESKLAERRALINTFVKEIAVTPDRALLRYTVPIPGNSPKHCGRGADLVPSTVKYGGPGGIRTLDLLNALRRAPSCATGPRDIIALYSVAAGTCHLA